MSIYKRGSTWWLYVTDPITGERIRESTGERERARAQRVHDEFKAELWKRRRSGPTLFAALDAWAKGKGEPDRCRVGKLKRLLQDGPIELDDDALAKVPHGTPGTYNRYLNVLAAAGVPGLKKKRKKAPKGRIRWLTAEEWTALRKALPDRWRLMADFAVATGVRQANVFWLEWSKVDLVRKRAWIQPEDAKAGEPIAIPLSDAALEVLRKQVGKSAVWVFPQADGNPLPKLKNRDWKAVVKDADIAYCTWHDLRHTWATWHLMNDPPTPLEVLQKLGGWRDLRMVMRYAHLAQSYVDQYAANAKPYSHNLRHTDALSA